MLIPQAPPPPVKLQSRYLSSPTPARGALGTYLQTRLYIRAGSEVITIAARRLQPGEQNGYFFWITSLFWKKVTVHLDSGGPTELLVNRNSLNKHLPKSGLKSLIEEAAQILCLPTIRSLPDELTLRAQDQVIHIEGGQIFSKNGTLYLKNNLTNLTYDIDRRRPETKCDTFIDVPVTPVTAPVAVAAPAVSMLGLEEAQTYLRENSTALLARYTEQLTSTPASRGMFYLSKKDTGLARSILYVSPTQIYYLENTHKVQRSAAGYTLGGDKILGTGSFKKVIKATNLITGKKKAVEVLSNKDRHYDGEIVHPSTDEEVLRELSLKHSFEGVAEVIHYEAAFRRKAKTGDAIKTYVVTDLYDGDLNTLLERHSLSFDQKKSIAKQLLKGLQIIHSKGIIHRDIKPENILIKINEDGTVTAVISDLGLSLHKGSGDEREKTTAGTLDFFAPEYLAAYEATMAAKSAEESRLAGNAVADSTTPAIDIFAMGVSFYELFVPPVLRRSSFADIRNYLSHLDRSNKLLGLIADMSTRDPTRRISIERAMLVINELCPS